MTKEIQLTKGQVALVDDEDYEYLSQWKWHYSGGYAMWRSHINGVKTTLLMHRLIMNTPDGLETDHINSNKLDNRRGNLRISTKPQNSANKPAPKNNTSGYKGVSWFKAGKLWTARLKVNGKLIYCGYFKNIEDAVIAYNTEAKKHLGEFVYPNLQVEG